MALLIPTLYLIAINGAPVLARWLLGNRLNTPLDGHCVMGDGKRLFGDSKTWRGVIAGILVGTMAGPWVGLSLWQGLGFGAAAMAGDALTSLIKRRLGWPIHHPAPLLDQSLEVLLPLAFYRQELALTAGQCAGIFGLFVLCHLSLSPLLYHLGIRRRPW